LGNPHLKYRFLFLLVERQGMASLEQHMVAKRVA
jgi:hypothetical protein